MNADVAATIVPAADARDLRRIRQLVNERLRPYGARIFLYGSRAHGSARRSSDVDVAVLAEPALPVGILSRLREELEESSVRLPVEIMDLAQANPALRERVMREGIVWND